MTHDLSKIIVPALLAILMMISSCNDDDSMSSTGSLTIEFTSVMDGEVLELISKVYDHPPGGTFIVDDFKYYISNIKLINTGKGTIYSDADGYYLIHKDQDYSNYEIELNEIPSGNYNRIEFSIGIDPARNLSIDNIGDLDPNNQMAWNWNIGYKFMLLEGLFTDEQDNEIPLVFHIGSDVNFRTIVLDLPSEVRVSKNGGPKIRIQSDVEEFFKNPNTIDFNTTNTIKHSPEASELADNYGTGMFSILNVE